MSKSLENFAKSLVHADRLIEGTKPGRGRPTRKEASMFVASVALTYAAWEAYIEDVAIEVTDFIADHIDASVVPTEVQSAIQSTTPTAWELTIHPGWRELWKSRVRVLAKGNDSGTAFGLNTAGVKQIERLFESTGVHPLRTATDADRKALGQLVQARGEVVHSASTPERFNKQSAKNYRDLVERLAQETDASLNNQARTLVGNTAW